MYRQLQLIIFSWTCGKATQFYTFLTPRKFKTLVTGKSELNKKCVLLFMVNILLFPAALITLITANNLCEDML